MEEEEKKKSPRVFMNGKGSLRIDHLSEEEMNKVLSADAGACFISFKNGTIEAVESFKDLPGPIDDELMFPFWRKPHKDELAQLKMFEDHVFEKISEHDSPAIYIQSLCGYYYTKEKYKEYAEKLQSYGFECLRSKRGADAHFWEVWYLPSLWFAQGNLKAYLKEFEAILKNKSKSIDLALKFLCDNVEFGSLSLTSQKLAQRIPE